MNAKKAKALRKLARQTILGDEKSAVLLLDAPPKAIRRALNVAERQLGTTLLQALDEKPSI